MTKLSGQCLCGDVKFSADGDIMMQGNCHCTDCRQSSGAAFATLVFMKQDEITVTGDLKTFDHVVDSGNTLTKHFCPKCGSQMFTGNQARANTLGIRAGTLDDHSAVKPQFNVYASSKMDCIQLDPSIPAFDKMPS